MSVRVMIQSQVHADKFAELQAFLDDKLPNVRAFRGCRNVTVLLNTTTCEMIFNEIWRSREQHQDYMRSIQENGVLDQLRAFLRTPPVVSYFDELDI